MAALLKISVPLLSSIATCNYGRFHVPLTNAFLRLCIRRASFMASKSFPNPFGRLAINGPAQLVQLANKKASSAGGTFLCYVCEV